MSGISNCLDTIPEDTTTITTQSSQIDSPGQFMEDQTPIVQMHLVSSLCYNSTQRRRSDWSPFWRMLSLPLGPPSFETMTQNWLSLIPRRGIWQHTRLLQITHQVYVGEVKMVWKATSSLEITVSTFPAGLSEKPLLVQLTTEVCTTHSWLSFTQPTYRLRI